MGVLTERLIKFALAMEQAGVVSVDLAKALPKKERSLGPPKGWVKKMTRKLGKRSSDPQRLMGWIWYHHMSEDSRKRHRAAEGKVYGPAKKTRKSFVLVQCESCGRRHGLDESLIV